MRYLLAHLLPPEIATFHRQLSDELASQFRLSPVNDHIDPHLTLKAPFVTENTAHLAALTELLTTFTAKETPQSYTLSGMNHFRSKVIYYDVYAPKQTHMLIRRLQDQLRQLPWLTFQKNEFPLTLHATLCRPKHPQQGVQILKYLEKRDLPEYTSYLDSITLLERQSERWEPIQTFSIGSPETTYNSC